MIYFTIKIMNSEIVNNDLAYKLQEQTATLNGMTLRRILPTQYIAKESYLQHHDRIQNTKVYEDDIWITTAPKSGTRWMQELVWCVKHNLDFEKAKTISLEERVPFFEFQTLISWNSLDVVDNMERPRIIKSHLPYDLLPKQVSTKKPKIIHMYRNPRDVCVSYFNHMQCLDGYTGDLQTFVSVFTEDLILQAPVIGIVLSYWKIIEGYDNMLFVSYEEMSADLPKVIKKVADFLDVQISDEDIPNLCDHLSIDKMRENPSINCEKEVKKAQELHKFSHPGKMINKGKVGRWKEYLSGEMIQKFEKWEEKWLKDSDLKYVYEV